MKRNFTKLMAAFALLALFILPLTGWGQTRESYSVSYGHDDLEDMLYGSYLDASSYWKVPETSGNSALISIPITYQPESDITVTFRIATFGNGTNPSASNTTITAVGTESNSNWSGSGVNTYPSSSTYVNGVMTITMPQNPTTLGGLDITMGVNTGVKIFRLQSVTVLYTYSGGTPQPTTYTVTYDCNGGTSGCPENVTGIEAGEEITLANAPTKTDYDFAGWSDGSTTYNAGASYTVNGNVTMTAQWTEQSSGDEQWVLTNLADLTASDVFVIVGNGYAMTNDNGTGSAPAPVAVTISGNEITSNVTSNIKWTVSGGATNGYSFSPNGSTNTWLYCNTNASSSSNNNIRVGNGGQYNRIVFELTSDNYLVTKDEYAARYLSHYISNDVVQDWRGYLNTNSAVAISFYKKVTGGVLPPSISVDNVSIEYNAVSGSIAYTINNGVAGGTMSAVVSNGEWLTLGQGTTSPISFTCTVNPAGTERTAMVTLTYSYGTRETATANITITQAGNPTVVDNISDITETGSYAVRGTIVAESTKGFIVGDGTGYIYYYNYNYTSNDYAIGDKVQLAGSVTEHGGVFEFDSSATITAATESNYQPENPSEITGAQMDARVASSTPQLSNYVQYKGTLTVSGNYYNITSIEGATTAKGSISNPINTGFTSLNGKTVLVKGYYVGVSNSQYYNTMMGSVEEVLEPTITVAPASVNVTCEASSDTLTVSYEHINEIVANVYFCDAEGVAATYDWIEAEINDDDNLEYTISANEGAARTAYLKVNVGSVYSNLVTINQAKYVANFATLPFEFDAGIDSISGTAGLTQNDLGTDYPNSPKLKFNTENGWLILHFLETPGKLTFDIKGNPSNGVWSGTFKVQTSEDGDTYTDLASYTDLTSTVQSESFNNLGENVRYIKWIYSEKNSGNVGLGNIKLTKPAVMYNLTVENLENLEIITFVEDENEPTLDGAGTVPVAEGEQVMLSVVAFEGYEIRSLMVDGEEHVNDIASDYTYTFNMPGHNVTVSATATEVVPVTYTLATTIEPGKTYIITSEVLLDEAYAMGAQNSNNRAAVGISVDGTTATVSTSDVYEVVISIDENDSGFFNIYDPREEGYLYAAGGTSSNYLKTKSTIDNTGQWSITIDQNGVATIVANFGSEKANTQPRNTMRFNGSNNPPIFSCYGSENSMGDIYLYVKDETSTTTQTIALLQGYNVVSVNVDVTMDDIKDALIVALGPTNGIKIMLDDGAAATYRNGWKGDDLHTWNQTQGFTVYAPNDPTNDFELEGEPLGNVTITLAPGYNLVSFTGETETLFTIAVAGFTAVNGDKVMDDGGTAATYRNGWKGELASQNLKPGVGYTFYNSQTEERSFIFQTGGK